MKVDLHNHTWYSKDGMMSPKKLLCLAKDRGVDAIAITDHNRLTKIPRNLVEKCGIVYIPGEEIKTTKGEIIALFINEEIRPGLSPEETLDLIRELGGLAVIPHPFDVFRRRTALLLNYRLRRKDVFIEALNGRYVSLSFYRRAIDFARSYNLPMVGGSDAHTPVEVGRVWTEVPEFLDIDELYHHLRKGKTQPAGKPSPAWVHLTVPAIKILHALNVIP